MTLYHLLADGETLTGEPAMEAIHAMLAGCGDLIEEMAIGGATAHVVVRSVSGGNADYAYVSADDRGSAAYTAGWWLIGDDCSAEGLHISGAYVEHRRRVSLVSAVAEAKRPVRFLETGLVTLGDDTSPRAALGRLLMSEMRPDIPRSSEMKESFHLSEPLYHDLSWYDGKPARQRDTLWPLDVDGDGADFVMCLGTEGDIRRALYTSDRYTLVAFVSRVRGHRISVALHDKKRRRHKWVWGESGVCGGPCGGAVRALGRMGEWIVIRPLSYRYDDIDRVLLLRTDTGQARWLSVNGRVRRVSKTGVFFTPRDGAGGSTISLSEIRRSMRGPAHARGNRGQRALTSSDPSFDAASRIRRAARFSTE